MALRDNAGPTRMADLKVLAQLLERRFDHHVRAIDPRTPRHRVEFSCRITESWALIYYRRHLVRLSPYLFLLEPAALRHGSHWRELDATLRHEAAHACAFHTHGHTGHGRVFHDAIERLGLEANGACDLGPENVAYRYVYACPTCRATWPRRAPFQRNYSCGECAPGRYSVEHRLVLAEERDLARGLRERDAWVQAALAEGRAAMSETAYVPAPKLELQTARLAPSLFLPAGVR